MRTCETMSGQTLLDIAVQEYGNADSALDIALAAGILLTDLPASGTPLPLPGGITPDVQVTSRYAHGGWRPATAVTREDISAAPYGGIDYMGIEIDFIIS